MVAEVAGGATTDSASNGGMIKGAVQFSEQLQAVPPMLRAGASFNAQQLSLPVPVEKWFRIPRAIAGLWQRETQTTTSVLDFRTGVRTTKNTVQTARSQSEFGLQRDKLGDIWDMRELPFTATGDGGSTANVQFMQSYDLRYVDDTTANSFTQFIEVKVDKKTGQVITTQQLQERSVISARNNVLINTAVLRSFDQNGNPLTESTSQTNETLIEPFTPLDVGADGKNLRASFIRFLRQNGMANRVPE